VTGAAVEAGALVAVAVVVGRGVADQLAFGVPEGVLCCEGGRLDSSLPGLVRR
jgi:hypothetical protein